LPPYGLEVVTAAGLSDAAEALHCHPDGFALAILSLNTRDGLTTLAALREMQPGLRTVSMTGGAEGATQEGFAELGVLAVVHKPFKLDELAALLLRLAGRPDAGRSGWTRDLPRR
jgi:ActR/RegA family two-component response regulator